MKKKFRCRDCGATRIWLHNWAVAFGHCDGKFIADLQRGWTLEEIKEYYKHYKTAKEQAE